MPKTWSTLIIDDEALARQRLKRLISGYGQLSLVGEAENGATGLDLVQQLRPDLIFLDIEMPVFNGFELLKQLDYHPRVIFTTAYDQYAVKAFEEVAVDYLLKPISPERLEKSINKLARLEPSADFNLPLELLIKQLMPKKEVKTLTVKLGDRIILVRLADIVYIEAEDKYVFLHTLDGKRHLTEFTLTLLEEKLTGQFTRINRSTLLNTGLIHEIRKGFNGSLSFFMSNPQRTRLVSGRTYQAALKEQFEI